MKLHCSKQQTQRQQTANVQSSKQQTQKRGTQYTHVGHGKINKYGFRAANFLTCIFLSFSNKLKWRKARCTFKWSYIIVLSISMYNHCYINSYLDEDSAPTIVSTIKGLNQDVGLHGKTWDETDGIDRCISTYMNLSMSPLLINKSIGELHRDNYTPALLKRIRLFWDPTRLSSNSAHLFSL